MTIRVEIHIRYEILKTAKKIFEFIKSIKSYSKNNDLELAQVANMNETSCFWVYINYKYCKNRFKNWEKNQYSCSTKAGVTVILWITANNKKW